MQIVIHVNEHPLTRSLGALLTSGATSTGLTPRATTTAASRTEFLDQSFGFLSVDRPVLIQIAFLEDALHSFRKLLLRDLAVLVGVKSHQLLDKDAAGAARATRSASTRTTKTALTRATWSFALFEHTTFWAAAGATATWPTKPVSICRLQFVFCQFAIAVFVQFLQRSGCILDFRRRDLAILVRIQGHLQRVHGWAGLGM